MYIKLHSSWSCMTKTVIRFNLYFLYYDNSNNLPLQGLNPWHFTYEVNVLTTQLKVLTISQVANSSTHDWSLLYFTLTIKKTSPYEITLISLSIISLLIYDLLSQLWINTYYMLKSFLKASRPPKDEMKCANEKMTWNTQDTNLSSYMPKANVDHTISGQGTGISTLYHSPTTPREN